MKWFSNFRNAKYVLIVVAAVIAVASLLVSNSIVENLKDEEERRMVVWASAMSSLINAAEDEDVSLELEILSSNKTIPVVVFNENDSILLYNNIESNVEAKAAAMRRDGSIIPVPLGNDRMQ